MTAVAKEDGINLRAAANKDAEVVGAVYENVTYTVTPEKTDDAWVCLQVATGTEGYASADYMEVTEGYRVAEPVDGTAVDEDTTSEETSTTETKKASGSVEENKQSTQTTTEKTSTTQQTTTEATTQANNSSNIGSSSRTPVSLSDADINLMAAVMTLECGNESYEGQLAVANVEPPAVWRMGQYDQQCCLCSQPVQRCIGFQIARTDSERCAGKLYSGSQRCVCRQ